MGIAVLCIMVILGAVYLVWVKVVQPKRLENDKKEKIQSQEASWKFTNVKNILSDRIVTLDGKFISCWAMDGVNIDLMSKDEINRLIVTATPSIAAIEEPYKIISIQKPYEISPYIADLMEKYKNTFDEIQKSIILQEIAALNDLGSRNDITNRQSYLIYWGENNKKFEQKRRNFEKCWVEAGIHLELLKTKELVRLCNLIFNPSYSADVGDDLYPTVPQLQI